MLDNSTIRKIEEFVYTKPRSVQEVAQHINKNWRTADRYIDEIIKEYGTIDKRTFRGGTRGALKIIYWASMEKASSSVFQEKFEREILYGRKKEDFSAFDIYQLVDDKNKKVRVNSYGKSWTEKDLKNFATLLKSAKKQILFMSGNLSFINYGSKKIDIFKTLEELVKRGVSIKVLSRIDLVGKKNIKRLLSLNFKYGKNAIEIRNAYQPVRATIIDDRILEIKEITEATGKINEDNDRKVLMYTIRDKDWIKWLTRIFWKIFSSSIGSEKRMEELAKIKY